MAKKWHEIQRENGNKLELTWFEPRTSWKKFKGGDLYYFKFPNSKAGYENALLEWSQLRAKLDSERPNADILHDHKRLFELVKTYYEQFGVPSAERQVPKQVNEFLDYIDEIFLQPELPDQLGMGFFCLNRKAFQKQFIESYTSIGHRNPQLPSKWQDRLERLAEHTPQKHPQTIGYWIEAYLNRTERRGGKFITKKSADDRRFKIKHFSNWCNDGDHVSTIDEEYIERYHHDLDEYVSPSTGKEVSKDTKHDYFAVFRMFVRWAAQQRGCELPMPANIDSKEFGFREPKGVGRKRQGKKSLLWTKDSFNNVIDSLPDPYPCYLMLFLNCGFRHVDLSEMTWEDLHLDEGRIVIQRNKLNQQDTAPVISYKLWDKTVELIKQTMSDHPEFVFINSKGGQVEGSIKSWWKNNKKKYDLKGKRLDFIRKTGSTTIAKYDRQIDEMYLGETLSTTARIHYSFTDGEPCKALDDAIDHLGAQFGYAQEPAKTITLTPELLEKLQAAGIEI